VWSLIRQRSLFIAKRSKNDNSSIGYREEGKEIIRKQWLCGQGREEDSNPGDGNFRALWNRVSSQNYIYVDSHQRRPNTQD